jgi:hypothetical protein
MLSSGRLALRSDEPLALFLSQEKSTSSVVTESRRVLASALPSVLWLERTPDERRDRMSLRTHKSQDKRACIIDLNDVTFIDKSGERLLRSMSKKGAQLIA